MPVKKSSEDRKRKYGEPTNMLAIRVPRSVDKALVKRARKLQKPKSETAVDILSAALTPLRELDVAPDLDVAQGVFG
jgi:hypothetical protein